MVAGHVIGNDPTRGLHAEPGSLLRSAYVLLEDVRMPLFTVLSGYVYAMRPIVLGASDHDVVSFLRAKVRRLLLPMAAVGVLLLGVQALTPGTNVNPTVPDYLTLLLYGREHLWFLQAVFLIFVGIALLDAVVAWTRTRFLVAIAIALVVNVALHVPEAYAVFSLNGVIFLLPYFLIGVALRRYGGAGKLTSPGLIALAVAFAVVLTVGKIVRAEGVSDQMSHLAGTSTGVLGVLTLYYARGLVTSRFAAWLGGFSYTIYLFHVFGAAGTRIVLEKLGITNVPLLFVSGLLAAIAVSICAELVLSRNRLTATVFLGRRWSSRPSASPAVTGTASNPPGTTRVDRPVVRRRRPVTGTAPAPALGDLGEATAVAQGHTSLAVRRAVKHTGATAGGLPRRRS